MKTRSASLLSVLACVLVSVAPACAQSLEFITTSAVDPVNLLTAPPKADSEETRAELELLLAIQQTRTAKQVECAKADATLSMASFKDAIGPWFTPANLPLTEQLLMKLENESRYFSETAKNHFKRKRPKATDPRITPVLQTGDDGSYPSGHGTRGMLVAIILCELDPERREAIMDKGMNIGWDRLVAGVHFPSDINAGRVLGKAIAGALLASPKFKEHLSKVKVEFDAVKKRQTKGN